MWSEWANGPWIRRWAQWRARFQPIGQVVDVSGHFGWANIFGQFGSAPKNGPYGLLAHESQINPEQAQQKKDLGVIIVVKMTLQMTHPETCIENRWTRNQDKISQDESIRPLLSNMKSLTHLILIK